MGSFSQRLILFFLAVYLELGHSGSEGSNPDVLPPSNTLQLLLGDPKAFPGQMSCIIHPECSGSIPPISWSYRQASDTQNTSVHSFSHRQPLESPPAGRWRECMFLHSLHQEATSILLYGAAVPAAGDLGERRLPRHKGVESSNYIYMCYFRNVQYEHERV